MYFGDFDLQLFVDEYDFIIKKWSQINSQTIIIITYIISQKNKFLKKDDSEKFQNHAVLYGFRIE